MDRMQRATTACSSTASGVARPFVLRVLERMQCSRCERPVARRGCGGLRSPSGRIDFSFLIDLHCHPSSALLSHRSCLRFPQAFPTSVCLKCASSSSWQCSTYSCRPTGSGKRGARAGSQVAPDPTEPPFTVEPPSATALLSAHRPTHPVAGLALALACANDTRMRPGTTRI